jgi:hypothetical protein
LVQPDVAAPGKTNPGGLNELMRCQREIVRIFGKQAGRDHRFGFAMMLRDDAIKVAAPGDGHMGLTRCKETGL